MQTIVNSKTAFFPFIFHFSISRFILWNKNRLFAAHSCANSRFCCCRRGCYIVYLWYTSFFGITRTAVCFQKGWRKMVSRVFSAGLSGINGYIVTVECLLSGGLPRLDVVGLPTGRGQRGRRARAGGGEVLRVRLAGVAPDGQPRPGRHEKSRNSLRPAHSAVHSRRRPAKSTPCRRTRCSSASCRFRASCGRCAVRSPWRSQRGARTSRRFTCRRKTRRRRPTRTA